jgi:hypothetical protein
LRYTITLIRRRSRVGRRVDVREKEAARRIADELQLTDPRSALDRGVEAVEPATQVVEQRRQRCGGVGRPQHSRVANGGDDVARAAHVDRRVAPTVRAARGRDDRPALGRREDRHERRGAFAHRCAPTNASIAGVWTRQKPAS